MICPLLSKAEAQRHDQPVNVAMLHITYCMGSQCALWIENPEQEGHGECAIKVIAERLPR